ncbi:MAG TPA: hypothetical protein ENI44_02655 [Thermoplasmatales archaeon]|nr:hypothetical protein [Thermoplasmatales archaeon]
MVVLNNVKNSNKTTIIIHEVSSKYQPQMERLIKKGIKNGLNAMEAGVIPGYGLIYLLIAKKLREASLSTSRKESLAIDKAADVMESMYTTLAENAGENPLDKLISTRKKLIDGNIDMKNILPAGIFLSELKRAKETVTNILRMDEVLRAKQLFKTESYGLSSGITIYTSEGCPWCARTKEYLRSRGISFREINVSRNPAAINDMIRVSGQTGTPVTVIKGQAVVGFDVERLNALLS